MLMSPIRARARCRPGNEVFVHVVYKLRKPSGHILSQTMAVHLHAREPMSASGCARPAVVHTYVMLAPLDTLRQISFYTQY